MEAIRRDLTRIVKTGKRFVARRVKIPGLSDNEVQALRYIVHHPGLSQNELAVLTGLDKSEVTRMAAHLEGENYILRESDSKDKRIKRLTASPKAVDIAAEAVSEEERFYEWLLSDLSESEKEELTRKLDILYERSMDARANDFDGLWEGENRT